MTEVEMFRGVYNELVENDLFTGRYDAKHGSESFMHGVALVMECIAARAGYEDEFVQMFDYNMMESHRKAGVD